MLHIVAWLFGNAESETHELMINMSAFSLLIVHSLSFLEFSYLQVPIPEGFIPPYLEVCILRFPYMYLVIPGPNLYI